MSAQRKLKNTPENIAVLDTLDFEYTVSEKGIVFFATKAEMKILTELAIDLLESALTDKGAI